MPNWIAILALGCFWVIGSARSQEVNFCRFGQDAVQRKAALLKASIQGNKAAQLQYQGLLQEQGEQLRKCRETHWPQVQALWIRVYPCDLKAGNLDQILDNVVNFGYNRLYVNAFYDGRVLLPQGDNPTVFPSVVGKAAPDADLLAQVIAKGKARGIEVYAWVFAMNFGPSYSRRSDRQGSLARNGYGETNLQDPSAIPEEAGVSHVFVDPYNPKAQSDLRDVIFAISQRQPDGILFDYIRYPHRTQRITHDVRDLMIYGYISARKLLARALSPEGQNLIYDYLKDGKVNRGTQTTSFLWTLPNGQPVTPNGKPPNEILWQLVIEHARSGVVGFLAAVTAPAKAQGIPVGTVFFPKGNRNFPEGVDPRLQPWDQMHSVQEWHPMLYALCGNAGCIIDELARVMALAPPGIKVCPTVAGFWNRTRGQRISVEAQFIAIQQAYPQLNCVSHFAYSWLDLTSDRQRRDCKLISPIVKID